MDVGTIRRRHAEEHGWLRTRSKGAYTAAGLLLTVTTITLCLAEAISVLQAIALALPATVMTLGGLISLLLPGTYIAWRRGFEQGCQVAMSVEMSHLPANAADETKPHEPGRATVTDLLARYGRQAGQRTQPGDRS
jgi:hypothetical protein